MNKKLPELPYKGLSYYGPEDTEIFAAREEDISRCAQILANPATRILLLHGRTGCGKSSFLRAGLIPFLEQPERAFEFLHETEARGDQRPRALFVRCTAKPLERLAECVYSEVIGGHYEFRTPDGEQIVIDLSPVLDGKGQDDFVQGAGEDPQTMVEVLSEVASLLPRTLVLVIDQAEEVLTVQQDAEGRRWRDQFFDFMALFSRSRSDIKVLIALRTEWYGLFHNLIRKREWNPTNIRDYVLEELTERQIAVAIRHPTRFPTYAFSFEEGVPKRIANDLKTSPLQGGVLPVMQLVCGRLYRESRKRGDDSTQIITLADYNALGGVEGQLDEYLRESLSALANGQVSSSRSLDLEVQRCVKVLNSLVKVQIDGTVTTDLQPREKLQDAWKDARCRTDFDQAIEYLTDEKRRILRRTEIFNPREKRTVVAYSLGHDAIGLAVKRFLDSVDVGQSFIEKHRRLYRVQAFGWSVITVIIGGFTFLPDASPSWLKWAFGVSAGYTALFVLGAFGPIGMLERVLPYFLYNHWSRVDRRSPP